MITKITKSKVTEIIQLFNRVNIMGDYALLYNDVINPLSIVDGEMTGTSSKLNGFNLMENDTLFLQPNVIFFYNKEWLSPLNEKMKQTGLKEIYMDKNEELVRIIVGDNDYVLLQDWFSWCVNRYELTNPIQPYKSFKEKVESLCNKGDYIYKSNTNDIRKIMNGNVLELAGTCDGEATSIRVSKNNFPFMGSVRKDDLNCMNFIYMFDKLPDGSPLFIMIVSYKKCKVIHALSYINYREGM